MNDTDLASDLAYQLGYSSALGAGGYDAESYADSPALQAYLRGWQDGQDILQAPPVSLAAAEPIRLVIWDLDETFWDGTLEEGGHRIVKRNIDIVRSLSARGIVNSIASKNHHDRVRDALQQIGLWDFFVMPQIAFAPKGELVRGIIEACQLRPPSVLFIDDNSINLNEVAHYNPGIQLTLPTILPSLLADPRAQGSDDPGLTRLAHYKILEQRAADRQTHASDNTEFLRASDIRISIHHDVLSEFDRVYDLVNRTNQLNFTKHRLSQDKQEARENLATMLGGYNVHAAYIKVADKYGYYGICGFYLQRYDLLEHFLFSCRALNMGVEQLVYRKIGRPALHVVGQVVSDPTQSGPIDWITLTDDAELDLARPEPAAGTLPTICLRGGCDLAQTAHYLRQRHQVHEEVLYNRGAWTMLPQLSDWSVLHDAAADPAYASVFAQPWFDPAVMQSDVFTGAADSYVFAFTSDPYVYRYRHKPTGLVFPIALPPFETQDLTSLSYATVRASVDPGMTPDAWQAFRDDYEMLGPFDYQMIERNLTLLFDSLAGRRLAVIMSCSEWGNLLDINAYNAELNRVVRRVVQGRPVCLIELDDIIESDAEVVEMNHFRREVYMRLATALRDALAGPPPPPVPAQPTRTRRLPGDPMSALTLAPAGAWSAQNQATAERHTVDGHAYMRHQLSQPTDFGNMNCFGAVTQTVADALSMISCWVWLPRDFAGQEVAVCVAGHAATDIVRADLGRRCCWQRISSTARVPALTPQMFLALLVRAEAGAELFSTKWELEQVVGDAPPPDTAAPGFLPQAG